MDIPLPETLRTETILFSLTLLFSLSSVAEAQDRPSYLPNPKLTPGATLNVTKDDLCQSGHTKLVHNIPVALKRQVFDRYGISADAPGRYDVDHLIPVGLGGSNSIKNLWPQPLSGEWSHSMKNKLERRLHKMVCGGALDLKKAQEEIAADWVSAYKKYISSEQRSGGVLP